jgi:hypothetical protein
MKRIIYAWAFLVVATFSCTYDKGDLPLCDTVNASYSQSIALIIQNKCATAGCHLGSAYIGDLSTYQGIKNKVDNGTFHLRVFELKVMPPITQPQLTAEEYQKLRCWYDAGAPNN